MARREVVEVLDDLDGKVLEEYETVQFSVDGRTYEFDTSATHADEFRSSLQKYLDVSRPVPRLRRIPEGPAKRNPDQLRAIRDWAHNNGYELSDRGRIPIKIVKAFDAAH